jgi:F-type H+-transporting ATPase subunit alpha
MEIIKQRQYNPVHVSHQVMIFYAAVGRYLDGMDLENIADFEKGLYEHMDSVRPSVGEAIRKEGVLSEEAENELKKGIEEYKQEFLRGSR